MADRICENCMNAVPVGSEKCPRCGIRFENSNPGGALPNGWLLAERYTVGRYLDIDGEGVLYSAIDGATMQRVLVKEFMPVTLCSSRDEQGAIKPKPGCEVLYKTTRADFAELYAILLRMGRTEGLVQVLDVLDAHNTAYAVMEKTEGPTLAEFLTKRAGPVDPARALALLRPVMNGVDMMHSANLIHRGISPENIILESGGTAKLCGYGTLALRQHGNELKPKLYPGCSAPEQYAACEFEGRYTDIYAIGAVLYRLVTGYVPIAAGERRAQDTLRPARALNRAVPGFLSAGIARAMRVLPAERIQTVADLRLALSGEGGHDARGPLGLTKQQLIIGASAVAAVILLVLVILLVSVFLGGGGADSSVSSAPPSSSAPISSSSAPAQTVPSFVGKRYEDVVNNEVYKLAYTFAQPTEVYSADVEAGRITSQTPPEGSVWDGSPIQLVVSLGAEPVPIPDLISTPMAQADAEAKLKELRITYTIAVRANTGEAEEGTVLATDPTAGTLYTPNKDKPVIVYVAGAVSTVSMPNVVGQTQAAAIAEMDRQTIKYRVVTVANTVGFRQAGTVSSTDPPAGGEVAIGATTVNLNVYGAFYMPDLSAYTSPAELKTFLTSKGIPYSADIIVPNDDPSRNGRIASLSGYAVNQEVTSATVITIHVYEEADAVSADPGGGSGGD